MGEIELYTGLPRSTKSLRMTMEAVFDYCNGRHILANYHLKKIPYQFVRVPDLIKWIGKTIDRHAYSLYLDEIQTEADGRDFFSMKNKNFGDFIAQCGKRNVKIRYESKFGSGAELRLRTVTDTEIYCEAFRNENDPNQFTNLLYGVYTVTNRRTRFRHSYPLDVETLSFFYRFYNTMELFEREQGATDNETLEKLALMKRELAILQRSQSI